MPILDLSVEPKVRDIVHNINPFGVVISFYMVEAFTLNAIHQMLKAPVSNKCLQKKRALTTSMPSGYDGFYNPHHMFFSVHTGSFLILRIK